MQPPSGTAQLGELSVGGGKIIIFIFICSFWFMAQPHTWHSNGTRARMCSPELVIPYTVKERHLYTHSWTAGFNGPYSPVSMIMHRKVQISHLLLIIIFSSGKSNIVCPLPQWHSSHAKHLPIPPRTCVSLKPTSITSSLISIQALKSCHIC